MRFKAIKKLKDIYEKFSTTTKPQNRAYIESVHALVNLTEAKDPFTKRHSIKVSSYAVSLSRHLGLSKRYLENIRIAAILHDIGKLGIKDKILLKPSSLTKEEFEEVKKHPQLTEEIVKPLKFYSDIITFIKHHHENWDGDGYPDGLKGEEIPLGARILSICDAYDALTSERAYRKAYSHEEALDIVRSECGKKYDPNLFAAFVKCLSNVEKSELQGEVKENNDR